MAARARAVVRFFRLRALRGGLRPREIENERWMLYPVAKGTRWALSHRKTGGLVEDMTGEDMRQLADLLSMLDSGSETREGAS